MDLEQCRPLVLRVLRTPNVMQVSDVFREIGALTDPNPARLNWVLKPHGISESERGIVLEVLWGLIIQGVLVPGTSDGNQGLPFIRLTKYGRDCIQQESIQPHDPDGYLRRLANEVQKIDPVIVDYTTESLQCFLRGLYRAGAVMLGAASEQAVLLLLDAWATSKVDPKFKEEIGRAWSIHRKFEIFKKDLSKDGMPKALSENLCSLLNGVFDLIRNSRNDAGHPASGVLVSREVLYAHLQLFIPYCKRIYELIGWFSASQANGSAAGDTIIQTS